MSEHVYNHDDFMSENVCNHDDFMSEHVCNHDDFMSEHDHDDFMSEHVCNHDDFMREIQNFYERDIKFIRRKFLFSSIKMILYIITAIFIILLVFIYMFIILKRVSVHTETSKTLSESMINKPIQNKSRPKIGIILTSTIKPNSKMIMLQNKIEERLNIYLKSFNQWFKREDFYIIIVENSGYPLSLENMNHDKHEIVSFTYDQLNDKDRKYLEKMTNKGAHEIYCINYAIKNSKLLKNFDEDDFIIKVTGRYYISKFKKILDEIINENVEVVTQSTKNSVTLKYANRCEIIGCRKYLTPFIFHFSKLDLRILAEIVYTDRVNKVKNIARLPKISITPTKCGGLNQTVTIL